jgi:hypothetical protein
VQVPCVVFVIFPVACVAFVGPKELNDAPPWIPSPSCLAFRGHEAEWVAGAWQPNASGISDVGRI